MSSEKEAIPFRVGRASKFSEEGAQLLANLTGVKDLFHPKDDGVETACCELEPTPANNKGNPHQKQRVKNSTAIQSRNMAYLSGLQEEDTAIVSVSERSQMNQHSEKNKDSINCVRMMDKSIDTGDLSFWTYVVPQHELRSSDEESENSFTLESHENPAANEAFIEGTVRVQGGDFDKDHSMGYGEYITRVKESMAFIQMRTQMLHELSLGEDPKRNNAKSLITTGKFIVEDKRKKEPDISSSISSASIAVKQARQLTVNPELVASASLDTSSINNTGASYAYSFCCSITQIDNKEDTCSGKKQQWDNIIIESSFKLSHHLRLKKTLINKIKKDDLLHRNMNLDKAPCGGDNASYLHILFISMGWLHVLNTLNAWIGVFTEIKMMDHQLREVDNISREENMVTILDERERYNKGKIIPL
eukprot:Gb_39675 [translate_table: standard]